MVFFSHCICIVAFVLSLGRWDRDTNFIPPLLVEGVQTLSLCRIFLCLVMFIRDSVCSNLSVGSNLSVESAVFMTTAAHANCSSIPSVQDQ